MRDIARIRSFCEELAAQWEKCPDMRFGQLIANSLSADAFYIEDDDALEKIRAFVSNPDEIRPYDSTWDMYFDEFDEFDDYTPEDAPIY